MMKPAKRWRYLRTRIITWALVLTVLVLAIVAVVTYLAYSRVTQEEIIGRQREQVYLSANRMKEEMLKFSDELSALARTEVIYAGDPVQQRAALQGFRRRLAAFDGSVVLLDNFGQVVGTHPYRPEIEGRDWSDRPYFRQLLGGEQVVFSDASHDGPADTPVVVVAVPITSARGEFLGALAGMFRLGEPTVSAFYASLVRLRMGETAYLIDGNGQIIYHPDPARIGQNRSSDPVVRQVVTGQIGAYRAGVQGHLDAVVAFAPVPGTPWGLIAEAPWATLTSPSRSYGRFLLLLLVLGIVLPALGFGLSAHERRAQAIERTIIEQQLHVARLIQQTLLPKEAPHLPGWRLSGHYQPAQAVGGDFYDFLSFPDGRMGLVIGDVTDKGVPAALVMATTRSLLRTIAHDAAPPGQVLQQVNELLHPEIPPKMFVTCLYAILDPATGRMQYANAGHNLPYRAHPGNGSVTALRARGMPLGLMPGMVYEEMETTIAPGECILLYSDGLIEAHNPHRQMFGSTRLRSLLARCSGNCPELIRRLLAELAAFTGRGWEQEDDVTLVTLQRTGLPDPDPGAAALVPEKEGWQTLSRFSLASEPGNERQAMQRVAEVVRQLDLSPPQLERLKTAVAEATMNAIEHGNEYRSELPVVIHVLASARAVTVRVTDRGGGQPIPRPQTPDLEAKIAGRQSPRGWGLFLIENMVDRMAVTQTEDHHTLELTLFRKGERDES
jgi:serine phosphatase RsbU (regulator of sigma subunit)/anti-sigma regulatory factor (Ser/Thr protein kinase)